MRLSECNSLVSWASMHGSNRLRIYRVPWLFMFSRTPLFSCCIQSKFWFRWRMWPLRIGRSHAYSVIDWLTHFSDAVVGSLRTPRHCGSTGILCSWGTAKAICELGRWQGVSRPHTVCVTSALVHTPLSHQTLSAEHTIIKNFKTAAVEH